MKPCKRTGKERLSRIQADKQLKNPNIVRVYRCNFCGSWHRTSQEKRVRVG
jgi:hypothetical protein